MQPDPSLRRVHPASWALAQDDRRPGHRVARFGLFRLTLGLGPLRLWVVPGGTAVVLAATALALPSSLSLSLSLSQKPQCLPFEKVPRLPGPELFWGFLA